MRTPAAVVSGLVALVLSLALAGAGLAQEVSPNWFRSPAVSPDGETVVFVHGGNLWSVGIGGGRAAPLTMHASYNTSPVWSADGSKIAFASDRFGNFDVFVMPAAGGAATRLTFHSSDDLPSAFTPDGASVVFSSARVDDHRSAVAPSPVLSELYEVSLTGGTPRMLLTTPALNARFDGEGRRIYYEDRKGFEDELRKHHTSSIARDIWVYDTQTGAHTPLTTHEAEDREPHASPDGRWVYFLSQRNGDFNVFRMPVGAGGEARAEQLTFFERHPVRHLSMAGDGSFVFSWHGDIYAMAPGGQTRKIDIAIGVDTGPGGTGETRSSGASGMSVAKSGKEIAFILRGEVFVTSTEFDTTRRITTTPEQERSVAFMPCGRKLVYAGERGGRWGIYEASLADEDELYFFSATKIDERPLVRFDDAEAFQPVPSPDGKKIAFLRNRSTLQVLDIESGEIVTALPGTAYYSYSDGDHHFEWSPDSRWLVVHFYNRGRAFVHQVGLVKADGSQDWPNDLTNSGYNDRSPVFAMKGGALLWASDRYGMRSHGSWGALDDVVAVFLTQDAHDRFRLSREEHELRKELEEKRKKDEEKDKDNGDDANDKSDEGDGEDGDEGDGEEAEEEDDKEDAPDPLEFDLENLEARTERLTIHSSGLGDFALSPDGDKLYYLARFERGFDLWVRDFRKESTSLLTKLNAAGASMHLSADGKTIFLSAAGALSKVDTANGQRTPIGFSARLEVDGDAERAYMFDHVWRQVKQKFYLPDLHGVD